MFSHKLYINQIIQPRGYESTISTHIFLFIFIQAKRKDLKYDSSSVHGLFNLNKYFHSGNIKVS